MEAYATETNSSDIRKNRQHCQYSSKLIQQFEKSPSWWKKRSILERVLILVIFVGGLLLSMAVVSFAIKIYISDSARYETNCSEFLLHRPISSLIDEMDVTIDPCDDFYKFACGGYIKNKDSADSEWNVNKFVSLKENVSKQLTDLIEEIDIANAPMSHKIVKILYDGCVNNGNNELTKNIRFLYHMIHDVGGWPVLLGDRWNANFTWKNLSYKMKKYGYWATSFFSLRVVNNYKNTSKRMIFLGEPTFGFDKMHLLQDYYEMFVQKYYEYMVTIAVALGANKALARVELKESLEFEMKLAHMTFLVKDEGYYIVKLSQMIKAFPGYPWVEYINEFLDPTTTIKKDELVLIKAPIFFSRLQILLKNTTTRIQANYAMWRFIHNFIPYISKDFRKTFLELRSEVEGAPRLPGISNQCIDLLSENAQLAIGALYVQKFVDPAIKEKIAQLISNIRDEFYKLLLEMDWMDSYTKKNAIEKASTMTSHIAYPLELRDSRKIDRYYSLLNISVDNSSSFLQNVINLKRFNMEREIASLRHLCNKTDWTEHGQVTIVNAFYCPTENSIEFPAAILQAQFFDVERPNYMNYGAIGFIVGHEITHGFDTIGRNFDKNGNVNNWWAAYAEKKFQNKAECIEKQYENYKINGSRTLGENIADIGAVKISYNAYISWLNRNNPEPQIPGLNYTNRQMFWISIANTWCDKSTKMQINRQLRVDEHSPSEFRVTGSLSNFPEFSHDFNCPIGSKMNPELKCSIW